MAPLTVIHISWKADNDWSKSYISQEIIDRINKYFPYYSPRTSKIKIKQLTLLIMEGKITASQFRALFQELTGDQSSTNKVCKSVQGFIYAL